VKESAIYLEVDNDGLEHQKNRRPHSLLRAKNNKQQAELYLNIGPSSSKDNKSSSRAPRHQFLSLDFLIFRPFVSVFFSNS
jgi:hypothetical protein